MWHSCPLEIVVTSYSQKIVAKASESPYITAVGVNVGMVSAKKQHTPTNVLSNGSQIS